MESLASLVDVLFSLGQVASLAFAIYGGWLAFTHAQGFLQEGQGRFEHRHARRARHEPRGVAGMTT
jgi:hypothetical protein